MVGSKKQQPITCEVNYRTNQDVAKYSVYNDDYNCNYETKITFFSTNMYLID